MKTKNSISTRHHEWIDENEYFEALRKRKPAGFSLSSTLLLVVGLHLALLAALFAHTIPKSSPTESPAIADAVKNPAPKSDAQSFSKSILNSPQKESANIKPGAGNSTSQVALPVKQEDQQAASVAASESRISAGPKIPSSPVQQPPSDNSKKPSAAPGGAESLKKPSADFKKTGGNTVAFPKKPQTKTSEKPDPAPEKYTLAPGDTLYGISRKLGVSWQDFVKLNQIKDPKKLRAGQTLKVPPKKQ